ncbi:MAG: hypothetical protein M1834_003891 [Cirrosporium novae-zelandiae]|nr:MAG: hypothetical protein M1834_003891 [Cirrosporium novae-zelandiae]
MELPGHFLSSAAVGITIRRVHWPDTPLPEYDGLHAYILDNVLTPMECTQLIAVAEARTEGKWEPAQINVGNGRQELNLYSRDCGRYIWDDAELAGKLLERVRPILPKKVMTLKDMPKVTGIGPIKRKETLELERLNERLRFLKYGENQFFARANPLIFGHLAHCDGTYRTPAGNETSFFTFHLYLNELEGNLPGGATTFHSYNMDRRLDVKPKPGRVLIFQQQGLLHSGDDLNEGVKYTVRSDMMYKKAESE